MVLGYGFMVLIVVIFEAPEAKPGQEQNTLWQPPEVSSAYEPRGKFDIEHVNRDIGTPLNKKTTNTNTNKKRKPTNIQTHQKTLGRDKKHEQNTRTFIFHQQKYKPPREPKTPGCSNALAAERKHKRPGLAGLLTDKNLPPQQDRPVEIELAVFRQRKAPPQKPTKAVW